MADDDTVAFLVRMPAELREEVRETAYRQDLTMAQVVRRALRIYVADHGEPLRLTRSSDG